MNSCIQSKNNSFKQKLAQQLLVIQRNRTKTLQVNLGRLCNLECNHCHQGAGPSRREVMSKETLVRLLTLLDQTSEISEVDLTGGAPELNPDFRFFVTEVRKRNYSLLNRCNLAVLFEKGQESTAEFMADQQVKIVASLPCYSQKNVDQQRGEGVFEKSIRGLQLLNGLGYGQEGGVELNLVYNPGGAYLPGDQMQLEADYKARLQTDFGISFSRLLTITNMPIRRFAGFLRKENQFDEYLDLLKENFNPNAAQAVMCRDLISVDYQGRIFDCDFNQAMDFGQRSIGIDQLQSLNLAGQEIEFGEHCFGCTAGAGSSCGGALSMKELV